MIASVRLDEKLKAELEAYRDAEGLETLSLAARRLLRPALETWKESKKSTSETYKKVEIVP
jgi:hypothetical protein